MLILQGARLMGTYASENSFGDTRVFLSWDRLLMPDAVSLELAQKASTDEAGAAVLEVKIDYHLGRVSAAWVRSLMSGSSFITWQARGRHATVATAA